MFKRFHLRLLLGFLLVGCGASPRYIRQDLWNLSPRHYDKTKGFHLVLVWKELEDHQNSAITHPEWFVDRLDQDSSNQGFGRMKSFQIVQSGEEILDWIPFWRSEIPTLRADANFTVTTTTTSWTASFQLKTHYAQFPYIPDSLCDPVKSTLERKLSPDEIPQKDKVPDPKIIQRFIHWIQSVEPRLYEEAIQKLVNSSDLFGGCDREVPIFQGKSSGMKEAFNCIQRIHSKKERADERAKDWDKAERIWLRELEMNKNDYYLYLDLAGINQLRGKWDESLKYYEEYFKTKPQGLVDLFSGVPYDNANYYLVKGLSLYHQYKDHPNLYEPNSKVAILLFDNMSNLVVVPEKMREKFLRESIRFHEKMIPLDRITEILRTNGFTDGGQLAASTPQELGKMVGADLLIMGTCEAYNRGTFKLVHAASGRTIFTKKISDFRLIRSHPHPSEHPNIDIVLMDDFFRCWPRMIR